MSTHEHKSEHHHRGNTSFDFHLEFHDPQERPIRDERLQSADFDKAVAATCFDAFREGLLCEYLTLEDVRVEPLFVQAQPQSPRTTGFQISAELPSGVTYRRRFGLAYFTSRASGVRAMLVRDGGLSPQQELLFRLTAYCDAPVAAPTGTRLPITLSPPTCQVAVYRGSWADLAPCEAWDAPDAGDVRVVVDRAVLEDVVAEASAASQREIGGFLVGHLVRDELQADVFVVVTGLVIGRGTTNSTSTSVTFAPEAFAEAHKMIQLRGAGENIVGWLHSHPHRFCPECPLPTPPECISKVLFYSADDVHLMETTFDQPYMVGLLAAVEPRLEPALGHLPVRLYGWRGGEIHERGFYVADLPAGGFLFDLPSQGGSKE